MQDLILVTLRNVNYLGNTSLKKNYNTVRVHLFKKLEKCIKNILHVKSKIGNGPNNKSRKSRDNYKSGYGQTYTAQHNCQVSRFEHKNHAFKHEITRSPL